MTEHQVELLEELQVEHQVEELQVEEHQVEEHQVDPLDQVDPVEVPELLQRLLIQVSSRESLSGEILEVPLPLPLQEAQLIFQLKSLKNKRLLHH